MLILAKRSVVLLLWITMSLAAQTPLGVTFETDDGVTIAADYYAPKGEDKAPIAILLHMYMHDRTTWEPLIPSLHDAGFAVLAVDLRGHGASNEPRAMDLKQRAASRDPKLFNDMYMDVAAAYAWLARQDRVDLTRVGLVGASVGCSVALDYAWRDLSVDAIVCLRPGEHYLGVNSKLHIERIGVRSMLLMSTEDERDACDTLAKINPAAEVRVVGDDKVHGTRMFGAIDGIESDVAAYLADQLGNPTASPVTAKLGGAVFYEPGSSGDADLTTENRRWYSSAEEARARGLEGPGR